jgi:predicted alpha/beta-fold hydrolase
MSTILTQIRWNVPLIYKRELVHLPDGGTLALDWVDNKQLENDQAAPIVLILPGLSGTSDSSYVRHMADVSVNNGWRTVIMNYRGTAE